MGLAGVKRRTKYSNDPNNNAWSKSTDGFGHKILSAQGWKPGQLLGAKGAAQAEHYTAANASHIRVFLREDGLGLGAKLGKNNAETFGLSTLSGIFGRLNGKSDADLEKAQHAQRDAELRAYQTHKFGHMTFVRGGLLVGDKMEDFDVRPPSEHKIKHKLSEETTAKRKRQANEDDDIRSKKRRSHDNDNPSRSRRSRKDDRTSRERSSHDGDDLHEGTLDDKALCETKRSSHDAADEKARPCKDKSDDNAKRSSKKSSMSKVDAKAETITTQLDGDPVSNDQTTKAAKKAERRAHKEERRKAREERRRKRAAVTPSKDTTASSSSEEESKVTTPTAAPFAGGRHALRQRWIAQKRLASMDAKALNEILMLKTAA